MRRAYAAQVIQVGRRGVLSGLVGGAFELGIVVLKWTVVGTVVLCALMVVGLARVVCWTVERVSGRREVRWYRDAQGFWRPYV